MYTVAGWTLIYFEALSSESREAAFLSSVCMQRDRQCKHKEEREERREGERDPGAGIVGR